MKFEVREIAVMAINPADKRMKLCAGDEVEVIRLNVSRGELAAGPVLPPFPRRHLERADYEIRDAAGYHWSIDEPDLRKRYPPGSDIARDIMANTPKEVEAA